MHNVSIGEEQIFRLLSFGGRDTLVERPELPGPSRRWALAVDHRQGSLRSRCRRIDCICGRPIAAVVVDNDDVEFSGILLPQKRPDARGDVSGLIPCWHNGDHRRPAFPIPYGSIGIADAAKPEIAAANDQVKPHGETEDCQHVAHRRHVSGWYKTLAFNIGRRLLVRLICGVGPTDWLIPSKY